MTSKTQQIENVRNLIRVAEEFRDSDAKLDMKLWANPLDETAPTIEAARTGACDTTLCLAGYAGLDPYFREQGLRTDFADCEIESPEEDIPSLKYVTELFSHAQRGTELAEMFGFNGMQHQKIFHGCNEIGVGGRISKTRTLNRIINDLKAIALDNFEVAL